MQSLTEKQRQILEVIRTHIEQRGHAPTVREIGAQVSLSSSCTVKKHLDSLEAKGFLRRDRYKAVAGPDGRRRTAHHGPLSLRSRWWAALRAALPSWRSRRTARKCFLSRSRFAARGPETGGTCSPWKSTEIRCGMRGSGTATSWSPASRTPRGTATSVVALLGEEATVKTFYREVDGIRLQPENPDYEPIFAADVTIMGKVAMAIKRF